MRVKTTDHISKSIKRPGIHSKNGTSNNKNSKLYKKNYKGQARQMFDLLIQLHWPHDRFALGWEYMSPDSEHDYTTIKIFLLVATLTFDF